MLYPFLKPQKHKRKTKKQLNFNQSHNNVIYCNKLSFNAKFKNMPCLAVGSNPSIILTGVSNTTASISYLTSNNELHQNISCIVNESGQLQIPSQAAKIFNLKIGSAIFPVAENFGQTLYATNASTATFSGLIWAQQNIYNGLNYLGFVKANNTANIVFCNGNPPNLSSYGLSIISTHPSGYLWNGSPALIDFNSYDEGELGPEINPDVKFSRPELWTSSGTDTFTIANNKLSFSGSSNSTDISTVYADAYYPKGLTRISFKIKNLQAKPARFAIGWTGYHSYSDGVHTVERNNSAFITIAFIKTQNSGSFELENLSIKQVFKTPQTHPAQLQIFNKLAYTGNPHGFPEVFKTSIIESPYFETTNPYLWHFQELTNTYLQTHLNPEYVNKISISSNETSIDSMTVSTS